MLRSSKLLRGMPQNSTGIIIIIEKQRTLLLIHTTDQRSKIKSHADEAGAPPGLNTFSLKYTWRSRELRLIRFHWRTAGGSKLETGSARNWKLEVLENGAGKVHYWATVQNRTFHALSF